MGKVGEWLRPTSIEEAIAQMRDRPGRGAYVAGGVGMAAYKGPAPDYLVDIAGLGLDYVHIDESGVIIGATTTIQALADSEIRTLPGLDMLVKAAASVGSRQIRNVATVGGNLASGYPWADLPAPLLALGARVRIRGKEDREIPLGDLYVDRWRTALDGQLLTEIFVPRPPEGSIGEFIKMGRTEFDVALVNVACLLCLRGGTVRRASIALGSMTPTPIRASQVESLIEKKRLSEGLARRAADVVTEGIILVDDFRASSFYRGEMAKVLVRRALLSIIERMGG